MSDNIPPFEIQAEILKRVPDAKSLLQFRSVSKSWKSLIDSPQFVADYNPHPPRHHIFVWYRNHIKTQIVSIIENDDDNHSFAQHKVSLTFPNSVISLGGFGVLGTSKGLFGLYSYKGIAVLWNPSIRKTVTIDLPKLWYGDMIGFGVSPYSNDPKLVRIQRFSNLLDDLIPRIVEVYSLSTGEWRTLSKDLPRSLVAFYDVRHVAIGKYIFWLAQEKSMVLKPEMIILFDMISEKFMEIRLPDNVVTNDPNDKFDLFKIRESLAMVVTQGCREAYHVWMMEGGVSDSFTKMYSIVRPDEADFSLLAFKNDGHPIIRMNDDKFKGLDELVAYEPDSEQSTPIGNSESTYTIHACSYMETLLLLDH